MTIVDAIKKVMRKAARPMSVGETYAEIRSAGLYRFRSDRPLHIVRQQIRRRCEGLDFASAVPHKVFRLLRNGLYELLSEANGSRAPASSAANPRPVTEDAAESLKRLHRRYLTDFKRRILDQLKHLEPSAFEVFGRKLLEAYGFRDVRVTEVSRDGGIDGFGRLRLGLGHLNVAFQCKRWKQNCVGRPDIDRFRGAIQGRYEQGIFFTTSEFTKDAKKHSFVLGAVPIVLVDGSSLVEFMIEKQFGIESTSLPIFSSALDLVLAGDNQ
jgi:restriction system protein